MSSRNLTVPRVWNKRDANLPGDAVYVGRPTKWGNPFTHLKKESKADIKVATREEAVAMYRQWITWGAGYNLQGDLEELRGKDLVCWCAPAACHADVLLELANAPLRATGSYRVLSRLPAWSLLDENKQLIATCRAATSMEARRIFKRAELDHPRYFSGGKYLRKAPQ